MKQLDWWEFSMPGAHSDVGGGYKERRQFANQSLLLMHAQAVARGVPLGPIPNEYSDTNIKDLNPHDSRWANDKANDLYNVVNRRPQRPREINYYP